MEKVLIIIPDNNKGKFISKGFSTAFKELGYYVIEKKIYDLNIDETKVLKPNIIFSFWSDIKQNEILLNFFNEINNINFRAAFLKGEELYSSDEQAKSCGTGLKTIIIHCAEHKSEIPQELENKKNHYLFFSESKTKKFKYIPAISPKEYKIKFVKYKYTITFTGNPAYKNRLEILSKIIYNYGKINIFCRSFDFYKSVDEIYKNKLLDEKYIEIYKSSYKGYVENQQELADIYVSSKINIDIENGEKKTVNYRCFEVLASGGFLIAPYNKDIIKIFEDGKEIETYKNTSELIDKINFYIQNSNISQLISAKGRKNAVSNHNYNDRLKTMLRVIYGKNISN